MLKVWALLDDRAGNNNQVLAVAEALDIPFEEKKIQYNKFVKLYPVFPRIHLFERYFLIYRNLRKTFRYSQ